MVASHHVAKRLNRSLTDERKTKNMDDHGQYDQWQAPRPVGAPDHRDNNAEARSGLGNCHEGPPFRFGPLYCITSGTAVSTFLMGGGLHFPVSASDCGE